MIRAAAVIACAALIVGCCAHAADPPREEHGSADAYAAPGVALAWGVLRGADEASTVAVVRIMTDLRVYPWASVVGIDPFTQRKEMLMPPKRIEGNVDLRAARASFADLPRTEFHLYASADDAHSGMPRLVVYFLGVPDTTPEFTNTTALDASLAARIERVQKGRP